jgi:hypothetical protein
MVGGGAIRAVCGGFRVERTKLARRQTRVVLLGYNSGLRQLVGGRMLAADFQTLKEN